MRREHWRRVPLAALLLAAIAASGCDWAAKQGSDVKKAVVDTTGGAYTRVKDLAELNGHADLTTTGGPAIKTSGCHGKLIVLSGGRPSVFKLTSYDGETSESWPSLFFQANTSVSTSGALANQSLKGRLYLRLKSDGPVWQSPDGESAELSIQSVADGEFSGSFTQGHLVSTENNDSLTFSGAVTGPLK